ncbi:DsbA family oxidoreductase [Aestuariimicrobium soli]|uniref:DsbA family oxidoreductase n=1 Tax=Aestuariimicrobium soli TaxID=2035834 RepID=UPI003EB9C6E7
MKVDIWSDIACPWCYIGLTRFERVLANFEHADGVEVTVHSFQLDPTLPESFDGTEIEYLAQRKGLPAAQVEQMFGHVNQAAATEGLHLNFDTVKVANSRRAHRVLHAARDTAGVDDHALERALLQAHFVDGESISEAEVLVRLAREAGLDEHSTRTAIESDERDAQVQADIDTAAQLGVNGVPFFVLHDRYGVSGAQPAEVFEQALRQVWDEAHPASGLRPITLAGSENAEACGPDGC